MSEQGSLERRPLDTDAVESSPSVNPGNRPKKGLKVKAEKKVIPETKLTGDVQKWLRKENEKAVKMK